MEVEGIEGETVEDMVNKYAEMDGEVLEHEFLNHETGVVEGTGGFRLLRMCRRKDIPDTEPPWLSTQVHRSFLLYCCLSCLRYCVVHSLTCLL